MEDSDCSKRNLANLVEIYEYKDLAWEGLSKDPKQRYVSVKMVPGGVIWRDDITW